MRHITTQTNSNDNENLLWTPTACNICEHTMSLASVTLKTVGVMGHVQYVLQEQLKTVKPICKKEI